MHHLKYKECLNLIKDGDFNNFKYFFENIDKKEFALKEKETFFLFAAFHKKTEIVEYLIKQGVDTNYLDQRTALHYSIVNGDIDTFKVILKEKKTKNKGIIRSCIALKQKEVLKAAILMGLDVNEKDNFNNTPIYYVKDKEIAEILVESGADLGFKDLLGNSLLHSSVTKGLPLFLFYSSKGVSFWEKNNKDQNPLEWAKNLLSEHNEKKNLNEEEYKNVISIIKYIEEGEKTKPRKKIEKNNNENQLSLISAVLGSNSMTK